MSGIAIVGMSGRFADAENVTQFWNNIVGGVNSIHTIPVEELALPPADREKLLNNPKFVRKAARVKKAGDFDAPFFSILPKDARFMDPQHRLFLECSWEAMEDAGYVGESFQGKVGVYAGCYMNTYILSSLRTNPDFIGSLANSYYGGFLQNEIGNEKDYLATRVAYALNLRGPSLTIQTACSTSLVAIIQACVSLSSNQCDMALAGASTLRLPQNRGYLAETDGMVSPDGLIRTFDEKAEGTVFGNGTGVVLLKRVEDAVAAGDSIYAVIKGWGINNDGADKAGFTSPSIDGQAEAIVQAHQLAGIDARSISYIEAHGTGTRKGDVIEVAALTKAFASTTDDKQFCFIGSLKPNIGHLDAASGVAGLMKTSLALHNKVIPPTINVDTVNPRFEIEQTPFVVNTKRRAWETEALPRRAGISSFGIGGTNAHLVVEEAPETVRSPSAKPYHILPVSAKTSTAADALLDRLLAYLSNNPETDLGDVAYTLQVGRKQFKHSRVLVAQDTQAAITCLDSNDTSQIYSRKQNTFGRSVVFMFPGQGAQHVDMGKDLYDNEPVYRAAIDACTEILEPLLGLDLRTLLYPSAAKKDEAERQINETQFAQPGIFATSYGLAKLWMHRGIQPRALMGHSVGEFVAACLAGVFSLQEALELIALRGKLMQDMPAGSMLAVRAQRNDLPADVAELDVAAINSPNMLVLSGATDQIEQAQVQLEKADIVCQPLHTSHAFHSQMMVPAVAPFKQVVQKIKLQKPQLPIMSTVFGAWLSDEEATNPDYWAQHLLKTVNFSDAVSSIVAESSDVFLEAGPGQTLSTLARQHPATSEKQSFFSSLPHAKHRTSSYKYAAETVGKLWQHGVGIDWASMYAGEERQRIHLPTYPFERKPFWFKAQKEMDTHKKNGLEMTTPKQMKTQENIDRVQFTLNDVLLELSGLHSNELDHSASFLELGFDSLFLIQFSQAIKSRFNVKLSFRQLIEEVTTLDQLTRLLAEKADTSLLQEVPAAALAIPQTAPETPGGNFLSAPTPQLPSMALSIPQNSQNAPAGALNMMLQQLMMSQRHMGEQINMLASQLAIAQSNLQAPYETPALLTNQPSQSKIQSSTPQASNSDATTQFIVEPDSANKAATAANERKRFGPYKPVKRGEAGGLTPKQQAHLDAFIERFTKKTPESKRLAQKHRPHFADPRSIAGFRKIWKEMVYQITAAKSKGAKLWDIDGNEYIDIAMGFGVNFFGHLPDFVTQEVEKQMKLGDEIGPQSRLAGEVAQLLCEIVNQERATFCCTGSEAVMGAIRLARLYTGKTKIVYFDGDYHGNFEQVLVRASVIGNKRRMIPAAPGVPDSNARDALVLDYGNPASLDIIRQHADEIAGVLIEPVQSSNPNNQPKAFVQALRSLTRELDIPFIMDEVISGFRATPSGASTWYGVDADLASFGKVLGGGLPIGAIAGKAKYMDGLDSGMWQYGDDSVPEADMTFFAGTFVRHPMGMAAAKAVLTRVKEAGPQMQEQLTRRTKAMVDELNSFFEERQVPVRLSQFASLFRFAYVPDMEYIDMVYYHLLDKGIFTRGFHDNLFLSVEHTDEDIEKIKTAFKETILELQESGFLPEPGLIQGDGALSGDISIHANDGQGLLVTTNNDADAQALPLTDSQNEIWIVSKLSELDSAAYNEPLYLKIKGALNADHLERAINQTFSRHEALHLRFIEDGTGQIFAGPKPVEVPVKDLSDLSEADTEDQIANIFSDFATQPFDLTNGPLYRVMLVKTGEEEHLLVFAAHHIVCDGWSWGILVDEIGKFYTAYTTHTPLELSPAARFSAYVKNEQAQRDSGELAEAYAFWQKQFATLPPVLNLPTDRTRPAFKSPEGATVRYLLDEHFVDKAKNVAAEQNVSLFTLTLAAFNLLICRIAGQDDIVVSVPSAGQLQTGQKDLVGHCVNLLPLRAQIDRTQTVSEFIAYTKNSILDAYDHHECTLGGIISRLKIPRDPSRMTLVEINFNMEPISGGVDFHGLNVQVAQSPKEAVRFDLFFNLTETAQGMYLDLDYNANLFDESTIRRWINHYEALVHGMATDTGAQIGKLPLTLGNKDETLVSFSENWVDFPEGSTLLSLFEHQVKETPEKTALVFEDVALTYQALDEQANRFCRHVQHQGASPGDLIGILLDRSEDMLVALLGVLKAGCAYVPMDPAYPTSRISYMIEDADIDLLVSETSLVDAMDKTTLPENLTVVYIDADEAVIAKMSPKRVKHKVAGDDLAYIIYTSGSTGNPKGVQIQHKALANFLLSMQAEPGFGAEDTLLSVTTLSFDIAGLELYLPIITGGCVVIASRETAIDGIELAATIARTNTTVMQATPATWRMLLEADWAGKPDLVVLCGGEAMPITLVQDLADKCAALWNMYGPTETTIWSSVERMDKDAKLITIGTPIANTEFYILDDQMQPLPIGAIGQLYIGGDGLAKGYLNRPEMTDARFVAHPFNEKQGARLYNTGDLARMLTNGTFECLGRNDSQVKVRGYRIELGEIESALVKHANILEGVVLAHRNKHEDMDLAAYYVPDGSQSVDLKGLRTFLRQTLPAYMVPNYFIKMDEMPRTPNGKVDRNALPEPVGYSVSQENTYVAPRTPLEEAIVDTWAEVLQMDAKEISILNNFFDLGGHSLQMMRVLTRLRNKLAQDISLRLFFENPTVEDLSIAITELEASSASEEDLIEMLEELEGLSKEEITKLLGDGE